MIHSFCSFHSFFLSFFVLCCLVSSDVVMKKIDEIGKKVDDTAIQVATTGNEVKEVKRKLEESRSSFTMSEAGSDRNWQEIENEFQLVPVTEWDPTLSQKLRQGLTIEEKQTIDKFNAFVWDDQRTEANQAEEYLAYMKRVISPYQPRVVVTRAPQNLLTIEKSTRLPFDMRGTSDLIVYDADAYKACSMYQQSLLGAIELKKQIDDKAIRQAAAELIATTCHASLYKPWVLATDLNEDWRFLWLEVGHTIKILRAASRADGILYLRSLCAPVAVVDKASAEALVEQLPSSTSKRQKLSPIKEGKNKLEDCEADLGSDSDCDSGGWDEEDRKMVLIRQVRRAIRNTPWLQDVCVPRFSPMSADVQTMFG
jgi:hypothetical protein